MCVPSSRAASQDDQRIRSIDIATGVTTTLAGGNGRGSRDGGSAQFNEPREVAIAPSGGFALVAVRASPAPPSSHAQHIEAGPTFPWPHATLRTPAARALR